MLATSIHPQTIDTTQAEGYNHTIQFYLVNEVIVAYKYNITSKSAIRFLVNATGLFNDKSSDEQIIYDWRYGTVQDREKRNSVENNHYYELKVQYLYNIDFNKLLLIYFGAGPLVNYQFKSSDYSYERFYSSDSTIYTNSIQTNERSLGLGISAVAGLDCKIYNNINLFVEYEALGTKS